MVIYEEVIKMTDFKSTMYRVLHEDGTYILEMVPFEIIKYQDGNVEVERKIPFYKLIRKEEIKKATRSVMLDEEVVLVVRKMIEANVLSKTKN